MEILKRETLVQTRFCNFVAKTLRDQGAALPYYSVEVADYVSIVAVAEGHLLLVRQFRPAVESSTLELPAGLLEQAEEPEQCARRELFEETGYEAGEIELLGTMRPDTGRLTNRLYCFFAGNLVRAAGPLRAEAGVELVCCPLTNVVNWILEGRFNHALHVASLYLAVLRGKIDLA